MANVRLELNDAGIQELLHVVGEQVCGSYASQIADACGDGYNWDVYDAGTRNVSSVYITTEEAYIDNLKNNTLLRNMGNGGN